MRQMTVDNKSSKVRLCSTNECACVLVKFRNFTDLVKNYFTIFRIETKLPAFRKITISIRCFSITLYVFFIYFTDYFDAHAKADSKLRKCSHWFKIMRTYSNNRFLFVVSSNRAQF